ncbi:MAG TPA: long-chain fatty acid--CoA ligase [Stellaceae bacterium]|jgi:long-chain acyl-CoA synthetase|nr:long-chain fatty acid--CoA ligase [Stellaceae bacterium]
MDYHTCPNLAAMFFDWAAKKGDRPFLWSKRDGAWRAISWRSAAEDVRRLARGLRALGIGRGDRVGLVAENRPEWVIADFAIMAAGGITVPAYTTHTVDDHRHLLSNSGAKAVIVSTAALALRVMPAADQISTITAIITMEPLTRGQLSHAEVHFWPEVMTRGAEAPDDIDATVAAIGRDDIGCLIYTSGTGGVPKGVMTTHANIFANCFGAFRLLQTIGLGDEVFLCFLPLSHSYEHTAGMMFPISLGAEIYFAEGAETLGPNMQEARPTIMTAVPRLYETLHQRILRGLERQSPLRRRLFDLALRLGRKRLDDPGSLAPVDRLLDAAAELLVRRKVRARFGGRLKAMVSGGAPLNPEIGSFFLALGVRLLQGYGQTEAAPVVSVNPPRRIKIDTVGPPLEGAEVRIAEDGEILVRGEQVMKGYWNDPEATQRVLAEGWLHTGDVGEIDADGYIRITDRKRDFIKNSGGDMLSPARVEGYLTLQPEIGQAMVFGDRRPYLVAVIVPHLDFLDSYAARRGVKPDLAVLAKEAELHRVIAAAVARVNSELAPIERVRRFIIATEPFTTANGQMTPTLKIKRHAIRHAYGDSLLALYESR